MREASDLAVAQAVVGERENLARQMRRGPCNRLSTVRSSPSTCDFAFVFVDLMMRCRRLRRWAVNLAVSPGTTTLTQLVGPASRVAALALYRVAAEDHRGGRELAIRSIADAIGVNQATGRP